MKKKQRPQAKQIVNRRARHDYSLGDSFVVGIQLSGAEAKALRLGMGNLRGAYVTVNNGELWLVNATITGNSQIRIDGSDQTRSRKLLAKSKEIDSMIAAKQHGMTIVPTELLTSGRYIKLRIALGRGKKQYDKRESIKQRDESRRVQAELKHRRSVR